VKINVLHDKTWFLTLTTCCKIVTEHLKTTAKNLGWLRTPFRGGRFGCPASTCSLLVLVQTEQTPSKQRTCDELNDRISDRWWLTDWRMNKAVPSAPAGGRTGAPRSVCRSLPPFSSTTSRLDACDPPPQNDRVVARTVRRRRPMRRIVVPCPSGAPRGLAGADKLLCRRKTISRDANETAAYGTLCAALKTFKRREKATSIDVQNPQKNAKNHHATPTSVQRIATAGTCYGHGKKETSQARISATGF